MSLLKAYLQQPSTQRVLRREPGEKGFSLIELVVVVAVLAILAAIAIPNFLAINDDARVSGVKNTLATLVKECAVKLTRDPTDATFTGPNLSSSSYEFTVGGTDKTGTEDIECKSSNKYGAEADGVDLPDFFVTGEGVKTCSAADDGDNKSLGCTNSTW